VAAWTQQLRVHLPSRVVLVVAGVFCNSESASSALDFDTWCQDSSQLHATSNQTRPTPRATFASIPSHSLNEILVARLLRLWHL